MGLFYNTWSPTQQELYDIKGFDVFASLVAFGVVLTQYFVAQWIRFGGKAERDPRGPSVHLLSIVLFWVLFFILVDVLALGRSDPALPVGYQITTPLVVFGGVPLHLMFCRTGDSEDPTRGEELAECEAFDAEALRASGTTDARAATAREETPLLDVHVVTPRPKVPYINNIKIFLTNMVIIYHAAWYMTNIDSILTVPVKSPEGNPGDAVLQYFLAVNQSYFMNLFFFFSGYFVPESFDKKGTYAFLMERVKRLGIPFVLWSFVIGPFCFHGFQYLFLYQGEERFTNVVFSDGPQWFILQLMVFNIAYAIFCGKGWSPKVPCPSLSGFFGVASALGLVSGTMSMFFPQDSFAFVPLFWNEYLSYVAFFFGGALAQRNRWMEALRDESRKRIYLWAIASMASMPVLGVIEPFWANRLYMGFFVFGGICAVSISLAVTVFFMDYVNGTYRCTDMLAKSMYTAYLLHIAFPLTAATKCWILVLEATDSIAYVDNSEGQGLKEIYYYVENGNLVFPGFLFIAVVALVITWPMSYYIRSIPGFSKVL